MTLRSDQLPSHRLDSQRLWSRLRELATIGATAAGGLDRPSLSPLEAAARGKVIGWARAMGFAVAADPIGNLFFSLAGSEPSLPSVLAGSYLDSQPAGGKYSGAYGLLAALEAMAAIASLDTPRRRPVVAVCWTNGEGSRFVPGFMGSEAFAKRRRLAEILAVRDAAGCSVADALEKFLQLQGPLMQIPLGFPCHAYIETHLEQGIVLEKNQKQIGAVTSVRGYRRFEVCVTGASGHVGTTPMAQRRDALQTTVQIINALNRLFSAPDISFTVGELRVEPNAPSVVPRQTVFSVDIRHHDNIVLSRLGDTVKLVCESEKGQCDFRVTEVMSHPTIDFAPDMPARISAAAKRINLASMPLVSFGGHDAMIMHRACPSGIIFIPCKGGISHSEAESIEPGQAADGARVLADVIWDLAQS